MMKHNYQNSTMNCAVVAVSGSAGWRILFSNYNIHVSSIQKKANLLNESIKTKMSRQNKVVFPELRIRQRQMK